MYIREIQYKKLIIEYDVHRISVKRGGAVIGRKKLRKALNQGIDYYSLVTNK